jgi:hypothetical protein
MCRSRSTKAMDVFVGFLGLFLDQSMCRRKFGSISYLFLYALILFVVNRNAIFNIFLLLLQQVCMCDQWLVLDLLRSGNTTLGVL